jgi:hypothetical protein
MKSTDGEPSLPKNGIQPHPHLIDSQAKRHLCTASTDETPEACSAVFVPMKPADNLARD